MAMPNQQSGPSDQVNINGLFLQHYLKAQERVQETLNDLGPDGLTKFNRNVWFLRSIITDEKIYDLIDKAIVKEKERIRKMERPPEQDEQEYLLGFVTVHECMKFLDHTLQITKRQVKILADQSDPNLPEPKDTED